MRTRLASLAAPVLLVGVALATASPASAATDPGGGSYDHTWTTSDAAEGGTVFILEHGDVVKLCDSAADGYTPRVSISPKGSDGAYHTAYILTASGGNGACTQVSASDGGVYNLPEDDEIGVSIWLGPSVGYKGSTHYYLNDN